MWPIYETRPSPLTFLQLPISASENGPAFFKMAAENSNKLILAKSKNVYQHKQEHLYFRNPLKFQYFRCEISW